MRVLAVVLGIALLVGCKNSSSSQETDKGTCKQMLVVTPDISPEVDPTLKVKALSLKKNCLTLRVGYAACAGFDLDLVFNGRAKKSLPPQVDLVLSNKGEPCDIAQAVEQEFCFDISKLQALSDNGKVVVRIQGYDESVVYSY